TAARRTPRTCSSCAARRWPTSSAASSRSSTPAMRRLRPRSQNELMTLLLRITLEMLVLGGAAPPLALALGSGRWHRAGALGSPAVGLAALTGILAAVQSPAVVEAASRSWALSALTLP